MKVVVEKLFGLGRALLPLKAKKLLALSESKLASLPIVYHDRNVHPRKGLSRGAVTISLDFEMAWAWQYARNINVDCIAMGLRERKQVPLILSKFDELKIPATWAIVGHLFLDRCSRDAGGLAHPDLPRIPPFETRSWKFTSGDWYQFDPCSSVEEAPAWYAPDLIEQIISSPSGHEVACHGFSHAGFGSHCPRHVAVGELNASVAAMARFGINPITFVFPGNVVGNFEALADKGFRIVRSFPKRHAKISLPIRREEDGIWCVHMSSTTYVGSGWTSEEHLARLKRLVDIAVKTRLAAHIWLHPSLPPCDIEEVLIPFLVYCAHKRDRGALDILTMEKLVEATEAALFDQSAGQMNSRPRW